MHLEGSAQCLAQSCPSATDPGPSRGSRTLRGKVLYGCVAATLFLSVGGGLPPELPPRRGKPPPLLPPLLGPSGSDRETMGLGPPAAQLTPPPSSVGLLGTGLRGLQKDSGPLPTPPGVRRHPAPSTIPASCPVMFTLPGALANPALPPQVSLLGEPPKDFRIPLNPYLNLHSLLPASNLAGKEARGWGGAGRSRRPAEGPLPNPPAPGGGGSSKAFQLKSRLLSPLTSARLPPEPGLPDSYGFDYPSVSTCLPCGQPSQGPDAVALCVLGGSHFPNRSFSCTDCARSSTSETARNMPDTVPALQFLVSVPQTLLPVCLFLPRGLRLHFCFSLETGFSLLSVCPSPLSDSCFCR